MIMAGQPRLLRLEGFDGVVMCFKVLETRLQVGVEVGSVVAWDQTNLSELHGSPQAWLEANLYPTKWNEAKELIEGGESVRAVSRQAYKLGIECVRSEGDDMDRFEHGTLKRRNHRMLCWRMRQVPLSPVPINDVAVGRVDGFAACLIQE